MSENVELECLVCGVKFMSIENHRCKSVKDEPEFELRKWLRQETRGFRYDADQDLFAEMMESAFNKALELVMEEFEKWAKEDEEAWQSKDGSRDSLKQIISKLKGEEESAKCPCHNEPALWTSYNPKLSDKKDHYTCSVTKEEI